VHWRLLTTLLVTTKADAEEVIGLYRPRWRIEQVFRALKSDGLALEETQLEDAGRILWKARAPRAAPQSLPHPGMQMRVRAPANLSTPGLTMHEQRGNMATL
jgi:hypothetical protein